MDPVTLISILGGIAGIVFGVITYARNKRQDNTSEGQRNGEIMSELGYIKSGVDDVKRKQEKSRFRCDSFHCFFHSVPHSGIPTDSPV